MQSAIRAAKSPASTPCANHGMMCFDTSRFANSNVRCRKSAILAMGHRAILPTTKSGDEVKLLIEGNGVQVKVEVNFVFRGTVLPVVQRPLIPTAQDLFTTDITLPVLDAPELYGGKLVAAMDRQHPRDIFDVLKSFIGFACNLSSWASSF